LAAERTGLEVSLVLAPRHPERAAEVKRLVAGTGRRTRLRSALGLEPLRPGEVLVVDSVGELAALYERAGVVFVGGSLVDRGGHNVLEPVLHGGQAVLFGPYTSNVRAGAELLLSCGAGRQVSDARDLAEALIEQLTDPAAARARGAAGRALLDCHRGATARSVELVRRVLEESGGLPA
jgi:3-deoxy-D-manno-octulosonic-acid transferase